MLKKKAQTMVSVTKDDQMVIPIAIALARHSGTKTQLAIINAILRRLQSLILQTYSHYQQGGTQLSLNFDGIEGVEVNPETNEEGNKDDLKFHFRMKDLGIKPKHYPEAFDLLMKLGELTIQMEVESEKYGKGVTSVQIFRPIIWLGKNVEKVYDPGWENTNDPDHFHYKYLRGPSVDIVIQSFVAKLLLRPERIGHMLDIALDLKSKYSIKLYWFLAMFWRHHEHFDFTWQALRLQLGIDIFAKNTTRNRIKTRYKGDTLFIYTQNDEDIIKGKTDKGKESYRWSEFKKNILDTMDRDFARMNEAGRIEYSIQHRVTMKRVDKNNTVVDEPSHVIFDITLSSIGQLIKSGSSNPVVEQVAIEKDMEESLFIAHSDAYALTHEVSPANLPLLAEKVKAIIKGVKERNPKWALTEKLNAIGRDTTLSDERKEIQRRKEIRHYAKGALRKFVDEELSTLHFTEAEEVCSGSAAEEPKEPTAEEVREMMAELGSKEDGPTLEPGQWQLPGWDNNLLRTAVEETQKEVSETEFKHWVEPAYLMTYHIVDGKVLTVYYDGMGYKEQTARQHQGFLVLLKHIRNQFDGRIDDIKAVCRVGSKTYEL